MFTEDREKRIRAYYFGSLCRSVYSMYKLKELFKYYWNRFWRRHSFAMDGRHTWHRLFQLMLCIPYIVYTLTRCLHFTDVVGNKIGPTCRSDKKFCRRQWNFVGDVSRHKNRRRQLVAMIRILSAAMMCWQRQLTFKKRRRQSWQVWAALFAPCRRYILDLIEQTN